MNRTAYLAGMLCLAGMLTGCVDRRYVITSNPPGAIVLRDGKYPHEEARGIDVAIRALLAAATDDQQVLAQGMTLFEGLYATTAKKR